LKPCDGKLAKNIVASGPVNRDSIPSKKNFPIKYTQLSISFVKIKEKE